jgi:hypothetical protein
LGIAEVPWLLHDRFDEVDLRVLAVDVPLADALARRLAIHTRVRVRLGSVTGRDVLVRLGERAVVGGTDDAALVNEGSGAIILLPRASLEALQRRSGLIPARAQLKRSLIETFGVGRHNGMMVATGGDLLVRHGEGKWSARLRPPGREDAQVISLSLDGRAIGVEPVSFSSGALFDLNGERYRFVEHIASA